MQAIVYKATNIVNGDFYIGMTVVALCDRKSKHFYYAERGGKTKFCAAIRKYGRECFEFVMLQECNNVEECKEVERQFISSLRPKYNLTAGGDGVWGLKHSDESKKKMSDAKKGKVGSWVGKHHSEESKEKISIAKKGKPSGWGKQVYCLSDGRLFKHAREAAKFYDMPFSTICRSSRVQRPDQSGRQYSYVE